MRCLMCQKEKGDGDWLDILECEDPLCHACRLSLSRVDFHMKFHGYPLYSTYLYDAVFASMLIQYKECFDEALKHAFIYPIRWWLNIRFFGYTVCYLPSSKAKVGKRGFHHLKEMYSGLCLESLDLFEKIDDYDQRDKSKEERLKMVENIRLKQGIKVPKKILLVDDTLTTGASMLGALHALSKFDVKICIYVVSINRYWLGAHGS